MPAQQTTVRLFRQPQSTSIQRFNGRASTEAIIPMQRLAAAGQAAAPPEVHMAPITPSPSATPDSLPLSQRAPDKNDSLLPAPPSTEEQARPYVEAGPLGKNDDLSLDLLDLETLAQTDRFRAAIIIDTSGQAPEGFINFTHLLLDGTTDRYRLENIARYMRDHTSILASARGRAVRGFSSDALLQDPIHFLFPGPMRGRNSSAERLFLDEDESERLGRYLTGGGFLLVDAGSSADDQWFLKDAIRQIRRALKNDGQMVELPYSHPVYSAYYDLSGGFPGENKRQVLEFDPSIGNKWFYPVRMPCLDTPPRGLWGIKSQGEFVAIISDLDLKRRWGGEPSPCPEQTTSEEGGAEETDLSEEAGAGDDIMSILYLRAATNVVTYALTRLGGLAVHLAPFAWKKRTKTK